MEMRINETIIGDVLAKDLYSCAGLLLLKAGAVINKTYKELLKNHKILTLTVSRIGGLV